MKVELFIILYNILPGLAETKWFAQPVPGETKVRIRGGQSRAGQGTAKR